MFVTWVVLYSFVGFLVTSAMLRREDDRDNFTMVIVALCCGLFWLPVTVAAIALVAIDAALAVRRV